MRQETLGASGRDVAASEGVEKSEEMAIRTEVVNLKLERCSRFAICKFFY